MLDYIRGDRMKKIIFLLSTLITLLSFSYIDGRYTAIKKNGNNISELTLIYRNNKIISAAFDKKNSTGLSEKLTNKEFATKSIRVSSQISMYNSIEGVKINFDSDTDKDLKELFKFLEEKAKKGEKGTFEL